MQLLGRTARRTKFDQKEVSDNMVMKNRYCDNPASTDGESKQINEQNLSDHIQWEKQEMDSILDELIQNAIAAVVNTILMQGARTSVVVRPNQYSSCSWRNSLVENIEWVI